ncbi:energy transducer TonB [Ameyamaea chiangmaiensis]|nr:energy transducer TonB [Ameyamaea chiangmaiensis]MBS4074829.1 energy transducer TonB [Ameyamaea chiangmaiensis]
MVRMRRSERAIIQRSTGISVALHGGLLLILLLGLPQTKPPEPPEPPTVEIQFSSSEGPPATPHKAPTPAPKPAPAPAPVPKDAPPAPTPPTKAPIEEPPPPPPPPPPVPPAPETPPQKLPDTPTPPKVTDESAEPVKAPPPKPAPPAPSKAVSPPAPQTETKALPDTQLPSHITQPEKAAKSTPDSHSLLATLDAFRADQKQTHAPKARANPDQGGAPNGGGSPDGDITRALSAADQRAVGGSVRRCYAEDTAARNYAQFSAHLIVTIDATGEARLVEFAPETAAKMNADPSYRALAERARDAVLSPTCSKLPIPQNLLGQTRQLKFVFRP